MVSKTLVRLLKLLIMEANEILEKLRILIGTGMRVSTIEAAIKMPKNNLSGIISGSKKFPPRWQKNIQEWLESLEKPSTVPYLVTEQEGQLIRLQSLGITTEGQTFEQAVNAVIFLAGEYKGRCQELEKAAAEKPADASDAIKALKEAAAKQIPKERDTPLGRGSWRDDQLRNLTYLISRL